MRVLASPAETGAVTVCLPQDVQAEAYDWPRSCSPSGCGESHGRYRSRLPSIARSTSFARPVAPSSSPAGSVLLRRNRRLETFAEATGIPVAESQAGKGSLPYDHPLSLGAIGSTGTTAANALAREADVVIGVGTRYADFTTASRTVFQDAGVRFVNINVASLDAHKHSGVTVVADARETLTALTAALHGWHTEAAYQQRAHDLAREWDAAVEHAYTLGTWAAARAVGGDRRGQRGLGSSRRRGLRGRIDAR
jgi:3D-(3,5/4)-trihydroxycyclohexane-1,2-dione acylhydrolase (decyclizing)